MASMNLLQLLQLTDNDLWQRTDDAARRVSYFEAAEGNYAAETDARNLAKSEFRACVAELKRRGIVWKNEAGYLV